MGSAGLDVRVDCGEQLQDLTLGEAQKVAAEKSDLSPSTMIAAIA